MSTQSKNAYSDWSREELEDGIAAVKAEIIALKEKIEAEEKRKAQKARLMEGIEEVKAKLRELGAGDTGMRVWKRKRGTKGSRGNAGWRTQEGARKILVLKLPVRLTADLVKQEQ